MDTHHPAVAHTAGLQALLRADEHLAQVLAGPGSVAQAAPRIVGAFCEALGFTCGTVWERDAAEADRLACLGAWGIDAPGIAEYLGFARGRRPILHNAGIAGASWLQAAPVWVADMATDATYRRVPTAVRAGLHSALAFPAVAGGQVLAVLELYGTDVRAADDTLVAGLKLLGAQVGQYLLRAQALQQLAESEKRFRNLVALSSDWFWEQDAQLRFVRFEGHGLTRRGDELAPLFVGQRLWEVKGLVPASGEWDGRRAQCERHEPFRDLEVVCRDEPGAFAHIVFHGDPIVDAEGRPAGYRGTARDITLHKQATQRIQYLSTHDELTGLPNRAALRQLVAQAVELARRYERRFALLLLDIGHFARVNEGLGRDAGDALLREMAQRLRKALRASDIVARLDGDTFAVLAHELSTPQQAETVAHKMLEAVAAPVTLAGQPVRVSACVGVAAFPDDAADEPTLMKCVHAALRAAKREGTNRVRCHAVSAAPTPRP